MSSIGSKQIIRKAHRVDITELIAGVNTLLAEEVIDINRLRSYEAQLKEKVETLKKCDEEIFELASLETDKETCIAVIRNASAFHKSVTVALFQIADTLKVNNEKRKRQDSVGSERSNTSGDSTIRENSNRIAKIRNEDI